MAWSKAEKADLERGNVKQATVAQAMAGNRYSGYAEVFSRIIRAAREAAGDPFGMANALATVPAARALARQMGHLDVTPEAVADICRSRAFQTYDADRRALLYLALEDEVRDELKKKLVGEVSQKVKRARAQLDNMMRSEEVPTTGVGSAEDLALAFSTAFDDPEE